MLMVKCYQVRTLHRQQKQQQQQQQQFQSHNRKKKRKNALENYANTRNLQTLSATSHDLLRPPFAMATGFNVKHLKIKIKFIN